MFALVAVLAVIVVGEVFSVAAARYVDSNAYPPDSLVYIAVTSTVALVLSVGYNVSIAFHLLRTVGHATSINSSRLMAAVFVMLAAYTTGITVRVGLWPEELGAAAAESIAGFATLAGAIYVFWTAARGLVHAERGWATAWYQIIGTFFMFAFLPLGIYFLQRRVRRLDA